MEEWGKEDFYMGMKRKGVCGNDRVSEGRRRKIRIR